MYQRFLKALPILIWLGLSQAANAEGNCLACHGDDLASQNISHSLHAQQFASGSAALCQSCHGASSAHARSPGKNRPDHSFSGPTGAADKSAVCLSCHDGGAHKNWPLSEHSLADVSCSDCHSVHAPKDPVLSPLTQLEVCTGCHKEQKTSHLLFSRHPLKEGIVACSSCHDPHGGKGPSMLRQATVNETCFSCHAEKRGPMLFEHEPVQDNCLNCHRPHGSVNDNMLVNRPPLLCQQCHIASRHPGTNYINMTELAEQDARLAGKSCLNCHGQIHGSNHPAGFTFRN